MILERYYKFLEEPEREKSDTSPAQLPGKKPTKEEIERQDHLMALQLQKQESTGSRATTRAKPSKTRVTKVTKKKRERTTPNTAFNAPLTLSSQLAELVGQTHLSRPQVVKQLWVYIKKHQLQDPEDKRKLICDDKMQAVFKKKSVDMFEMNRLLGKHLFKSDEILESAPAADSSNIDDLSTSQESDHDTKDIVSKNEDESNGNVKGEGEPGSTKSENVLPEPRIGSQASRNNIKSEENESEISDVDD